MAPAPLPSISVIVPTFREAENLPPLIARIAAVKAEHGLDLEVLVMDDESGDGSVEAVAAAGHDWARIVVRHARRGLSAAVVDGLRLARNDVVVVMDADLSHPPEQIPSLVLALQAGFDFVIGSRYVAGGSTDDDWGFFRWLNSRVATLLSRPLTSALDPMSGFFATRRRDLERAHELSPVGYKIGLELIVKCGLGNVGEIPIHFADRRFGSSKLTVKQQLLYLEHLRRLYLHKFGTFGHFVHFAAVGATGVVVNLGILTLLVALGVPETPSIAAGIGVSLVSNFLLNRRFTFSYAQSGRAWRQFLGFCAASSVGALLNLATATTVAELRPGWPVQIAALCGVGAGFGFNFLANRFFVFRQRFVRPRPPKR